MAPTAVWRPQAGALPAAAQQCTLSVKRERRRAGQLSMWGDLMSSDGTMCSAWLRVGVAWVGETGRSMAQIPFSLLALAWRAATVWRRLEWVSCTGSLPPKPVPTLGACSRAGPRHTQAAELARPSTCLGFRAACGICSCFEVLIECSKETGTTGIIDRCIACAERPPGTLRWHASRRARCIAPNSRISVTMHRLYNSEASSCTQGRGAAGAGWSRCGADWSAREACCGTPPLMHARQAIPGRSKTPLARVATPCARS